MSGAPGPGPGRSPLPCAPRPAAVLQLGGGAEPARPGVAVIDLRFPRGAAADVQEIVFRNFYTAFLSVRVQRPGPAGSRRWVTCLRDYCLMPCPHTEEGSQNYFSLHRHQVGMAGQWPRHHPHPLGLTSGRLLVSGALMPHCAPTAAVVRSPRCLPCQSFSAARVPVPARAPLSPDSRHNVTFPSSSFHLGCCVTWTR
ncbi:nicolin-1 isoform 7-T9 [Alca torda]